MTPIARAFALALALSTAACSWSARSIHPPLGEKPSQNKSLQQAPAKRGGTVERHEDNGQPCAHDALDQSSTPAP
ncbi:MAG: hypothetical protein KC549_01725 [Myxococcales bacterium]|nr:hypothetical protein [Myxococcales bacterium]MCB9549838.1 hypothetical protein [Myxococcales bacterium]